MATWDDVITDRDREVIEAAGYGQRQELGPRPALLVVDVTYAFTGREPMPVLEAIAQSRTSCGEAAWRAVDAIARILPVARSSQVPVIYSRGRTEPSASSMGRWSSKNRRTDEDLSDPGRNDIVAEIAPVEGDVVVEKAKPSIFFGTDIVSILVDRGVDSLVVVGGATSGCVRASVVDAFSYNYRVAVVEEGTFDRSETSHKVNLFDMHAKYANIWKMDEAVDYLESVGVP